jgi:plasmid maintenance system antidote protein VapI
MANNDTEWTFAQSLKQYENDPEFVADGLALDYTEEMLKIMEERGLSQTWLAEKMGVSRAHISRILNAQPNMTLLTIAKIAIALDMKVNISLVLKEDKHQNAPAKTHPPDDFYQLTKKRQSGKDILVVREKRK